MRTDRARLTEIKTLIAEDDPAIRLLLRHRLQADRFRVEEAYHLGRAPEEARAYHCLPSCQWEPA